MIFLHRAVWEASGQVTHIGLGADWLPEKLRQKASAFYNAFCAGVELPCFYLPPAMHGMPGRKLRGDVSLFGRLSAPSSSRLGAALAGVGFSARRTH